ncbi:MAG: CHAP domain-containing protein [Patescibacteria group bacterium]
MRVEKIQKFITWGASLILGFALFLIPLSSSATSLSDLQKQQTAKQQQAAAAAAAAATAQKQADAINTQINNLNSQITSTQNAIDTTENQITETQTTIDDLARQIEEQQNKLDEEKIKLNNIVVSWYMEGDNSGLTYALLSSGTLSDAVTKQQYYDAIKQQIQTETEKINEMKDELSKQKADQDSKMAELKSLRDQKESYFNSITAQKSYKNTLLTGTLAQKQSYLDRVEALKSEIHNLSDAIYALRQKLGAGEIVKDQGCGGYPYCYLTPDTPDPDPPGYGFLVRECTSYASWYFNVMEGKAWHNTRPGNGDAANWPVLAGDQGYSVSSTPRVGAIISWQKSTSMPYGHVAIVQAINGDGTIDVSEYNWSKFKYSYRENVNPGRYGGYSYIY